MPEDMPGRMPEDMPDRMPEDMSDRLPEDLPVTKFIMVGITRSKVCFLCFFSFLTFCWKEEWVWSEFGDSPNSLQTQTNSFWSYVFSFIVFFIFVWKRRTTLEWVWRFFKLPPNSLQTHMFSFFLFLCYFLFILLFWKRGMIFCQNM